MQFQIKRDILLKSLAVAHNVIERKNTLPILSNVLLNIKDKELTATDLDLIFQDNISDLKIEKEEAQQPRQPFFTTFKKTNGKSRCYV